MQIQWLKTDTIIPYEQNSRKHSDAQIDRLANAIAKYKWTQPIVVDENFIVLAGHGRLLAAKKLKEDQVPCYVMTELTEADKRAYRVLDNKLAADSDWDIDSLKSELEHLKEIDYDLESFGLDDWDGTDVEFEKEPEALPEDDFQPEGNLQVDVKPGDVVTLGAHIVICGDAKTVDSSAYGAPLLMVTDPPYGVQYDPEWREDHNKFKGKRATGKVTNDDEASWLEVLQRFPGNVIYLWHAGRFAALTALDLKSVGFEIRNQIIWRKQHFVLSRGNYHWQHEPCWYVVRKGTRSGWCGDRTQSTIWDIANRNPFGGEKEDDSTIHSTQKPIECMARPIRNHEPEFVFDPFLGSGTTLIACEALKRKCIGIEIEPTYVQVTINRYRNYCSSQNVPFQCTINGKEYP